MSTFYTIDPQVASDVAGEMQVASQRIMDLIDEVDQTVQANLTDWEDSAKQQYTIQHNKWTTSAMEMISKLNSATSALGIATQNYVTTTQRATQMWSY